MAKYSWASKHFEQDEFQCPCCLLYPVVDYFLVTVLEDVREHFNQPVLVTSGYRCRKRNEEVGGSPNSYHRKGRAADIVVADTANEEVYHYLVYKYPDTLGIRCYTSHIHVDTRERPHRYRWQTDHG